MDRCVFKSMPDKAAVNLQPQSCRNLRKNIVLCAYWSTIVLQNWLLEFGRRLTRNASNSRDPEFKPGLHDRSACGFRDCTQ